MNRPTCLLAAASTVILHLGVALADPAAEGVASALFEQGRRDMRRGAYDAACPEFAESHRIDPSSGTLLNLLLCEEKLGKLASACLHGRELLDRLPPADDRRSIVQRRLSALEPRVPKLTIQLAPAAPEGTRVTLNGVELGVSSFGIALPIDPGWHRVSVTAPDRTERVSDVDVQEGKDVEWMAEPGEEIKAAPLQSVPPRPTRNEGTPLQASPRAARSFPNHGAPPKWLGWTAAGIGIAGLTAGAVLGVLTLDRKATVDRNCHDGLCDDRSGLDATEQGKTLLIGAVAGLAVGAVGLGVGVYVLTRPDGAATADTPQSHSSKRSVVVATWSTSF